MQTNERNQRIREWKIAALVIFGVLGMLAGGLGMLEFGVTGLWGVLSALFTLACLLMIAMASDEGNGLRHEIALDAQRAGASMWRGFSFAWLFAPPPRPAPPRPAATSPPGPLPRAPRPAPPRPAAPRSAFLKRLRRPRAGTVLAFAVFALLATWIFPPGYEKDGGHVKHGWFLLFSDTQLRVDFERLVLLDAIIFVSCAALAWKLRERAALEPRG